MWIIMHGNIVTLSVLILMCGTSCNKITIVVDSMPTFPLESYLQLLRIISCVSWLALPPYSFNKITWGDQTSTNESHFHSRSPCLILTFLPEDVYVWKRLRESPKSAVKNILSQLRWDKCEHCMIVSSVLAIMHVSLQILRYSKGNSGIILRHR